MSGSKHRVLVVEDDRGTAEELSQILDALDCEVHLTDNRSDALDLIRSVRFCAAIVDLEIKREPSSLRGRVDQGRALVKELRSAFPERVGRGHRLPILVASGFARDVPTAVELMHDGADDILEKIYTSGQASEKLRSIFLRSEHPLHDGCSRDDLAEGPAALPELQVSIPGHREKQRTEVRVGERSAWLPDGSLRLLLALIVGQLEGRHVHKSEVGGTDAKGYKGISELNDQLRPALPPTCRTLTKNHYHGNYSFIDGVTVGEIAVMALHQLDNALISRLVNQIAASRGQESGRNS
jgi:ActR/RegA family two-component response regulator